MFTLTHVYTHTHNLVVWAGTTQGDRTTVPYVDAEPKETVRWTPSPQELALFDLSDAKSHQFF